MNNEVTPLNLLFRSTGLLTKIVSYMARSEADAVLNNIIDGDYKSVLDSLNRFRDQYRDSHTDSADKLLVLLLVDQYLNDLSKTIYIVNDLFVHKQDNGYRHIVQVLESHGLLDAEAIGKEVFDALFVKNLQRKSQIDDADDLAEYARRVRMLKNQ